MRDSSLQNAKILIIDDEVTVVEVFERCLRMDGYQSIMGATRSYDAIRIFKEFEPDLVILDLVMPGVSGMTLLAELRAIIPPELHLPILVVTGDPSVEVRRKALALGASDFVSKPYDSVEILARIGNLLETLFLGRKKAEQAMRDSEERFFAAFEHAPIGVALVSLTGQWLKVNRSLCEMLGYEEAELLSLNFREVTHPEDFRVDAENMRLMQAGETRSYQREKRYIHRQGRFVTVLLNVSVVCDTHGRPRHFISQIQDITARKHAEEAMRESEERFSGAFEFAPIGVALVSPDGRWLKVNRAICEVVGYSEAELLSRTFQDITHPEDLDTDLEFMRRLLAGEISSYNMEKRYFHALGHVVTASLHVSLVRKSTGEPLYFISHIQDISERKRTEEIVERLASIVENSDEAIISETLNGFITTWNPAAEKMFGYTVSEIVGQPLNVLIPPDRPSEESELLAAFSPGKPVLRFESVRIRKNGQPFDVSVTISPIKDSKGRVVGASKIVRDITEQNYARREIERLNADLEQRVAQRTEALFAATREAERANRAKSDFLSRASHELRTPLNAILGFGQLLEMDRRDPKEADDIAQILTAGRHLLELIDELLDISSLEGGGMKLTIESCPIGPVIEEALNLVRPMAAAHDVALGNIALSQLVLVDRQRLRQVIFNLLVNAIKFNRQGGRVTFAAEEVENARLRLTITDTGLGLAAEDLSKVFLAFERSSASNIDDGLGIGLAISRRLVELMGGRIGVESVLGEGSAFWIELPMVERSLTPLDRSIAPSIRNPHSAIRNQKLLLYMEEGLSSFLLIARMLARRPVIELCSADTFDFGIELARDRRPDLILLNLHLPGGRGEQVLMRLHEDLRTFEIPVVVIGADEPPETRDQMMLAGARAFLKKPVEMRSLLTILDELLGL